jgi:P4 family phage/plasmid primase-like protien
MQAKPSVDFERSLAQVRTVCHAVHGETGSFGLLLRDRTTHIIQQVKHSYGTFAEQESTLIKYGAAGWEPYMLTAFTNSMGHARGIVVESWAIAADFDDGLPALLKSNPLVQPNILISTSPERYHAIWILESACSPLEMQYLVSVIQDRLGGDPAFARTNQTIRLPGFLNQKNGHKVKLLPQHQSETPYPYDFLCQAFDADLVANRLRKINHRYDEFLGVPRTHSADELIEDARSALEYVTSSADEYSSWIKIGLALAGLGDAGLPLFREFSRKSKKYDANETDKKWKSLLAAADSSSIKTLFSAAQHSGWKNPGFRHKTPTTHVLTDREFGALCADAMHDEFAAIESTSLRGGPLLLKLEGGNYRALTDIERRREVERIGKQVIFKLASANEDSGFKTAWLKKIGTNKGLNEACEHIAEFLIAAHERNKVRSYPYLPVANGVLNLLSRELVPHRYMPLPMCSAPVGFDPTATSPLLACVVLEIFEEDEEMVRFIYQLFGLILLGKPTQNFFVWFGPTASNGKSLLVKTLKNVLGPYFTLLPTASLMVKSHTTDGANPSIAQLAGKRLAVISEPTAKQVLDATLIKQLTGDGHINVRDNYGAPKDMEVEAVLLMVANYMPAARDDDNGLWRRAVVVPFNRSFTAEEDDKQLPEKLAKEMPGILNMMLDGAHDYLRHGLVIPEKISTCVDVQRKEIDPFASFAADSLLSAAESSCLLKDIYAAYVEWSKLNSHLRRLTKQEISKRLEKQYTKRTSGNLPVFDGVNLMG